MSSTENKDRLVNTVLVTDFGGFDKIKIENCPVIPTCCGEEDIELLVSYCGVNFADLYLRQGLIPKSTPFILGLECVGVVQDIGCKVTTFKKGQRVLCYRGDGGLYQDTVIVHEKYCFPIPDIISFQTAVAIPANYLTAYFCLFEFGNLRSGQTILLHSCAGGVGWAATQLAKTVKNVVIVGTASSYKHEAVKVNGVDYVVHSHNYLQELNNDKKLSKIKFDIIVDSIGGNNIEISQKLVNTFGKVIVIGVNHIIKGEEKLRTYQLLKLWWKTKNIEIRNLMTENYMVAGLHLTNAMEKNPQKIAEIMNKIFDLILTKSIEPRIDSIFDFKQVIQCVVITG